MRQTKQQQQAVATCLWQKCFKLKFSIKSYCRNKSPYENETEFMKFYMCVCVCLSENVSINLFCNILPYLCECSSAMAKVFSETQRGISNSNWNLLYFR